MKELIEKYLNNGLADFEGLEVSGSVPVKQEVINEFIASFLQSASGEVTTATNTTPPVVETKAKSGNTATKGGGLPVKALIGMVKRAEVQAVEGKLIFHFTVKR